MSFLVVSLQQMSKGSAFRGDSLRGDATLLSPYLGVDHYWMTAPTFPLHQHTAISAVSYLLLDSETGMSNRDTIGTQNLIRPGGLHWTTAGRGVAHEEVPSEAGKAVHGLQFFVALPPDQRNIAPFPLMIEPEDVPVIHMPGATVRVPLGKFGSTRSPLTPPTEVTLLDISLDAEASVDIPVAAGHTVFALPINGVIEVNGHFFSRENLKVPVFPAQAAAHQVTLRTSGEHATLVLFSGPSLPQT